MIKEETKNLKNGEKKESKQSGKVNKFEFWKIERC